MTNVLVGDVYAKIIEEVVAASSNDFEESGVSQTTLQELQQEWQAKLSMRRVAQMPWDPKPAPAPPIVTPPTSLPSAAGNGISNSYTYDDSANGVNGGPRIKAEPGTEPQYGSNGYAQNPQPQGGLARAQQLVQAYGGPAASASINAMQRGGLALPGQHQQPQPRPQGLHLPGQGAYSQQQMQQQQQAAMQRQQQQQQQQQQHLRQSQQQAARQQQPNIKVENDVPTSYAQTDGADEGLDEWKAMLAQRRAMSQGQTAIADNMMRDQILNLTASLESGLMVPFTQQPRRARTHQPSRASLAPVPEIPQTDGVGDDNDAKDEEDEDAINSDLDDSDDEGPGQMGDDDDDNGDSILCTYDKVQRVKNKWKCTLKDGILGVDGKEYVFHKGTGEFEW